MFATVNYYLALDGLAADFDHYNPGANEFFEAKTRHEILLRDWAKNQPLVLARLLEQATRQFEVLTLCASPGWRLVWFFDDPEVAAVAALYLAGIVDEVRGVPWLGRGK